MAAYLIGFILQGTGTIFLAVRASRESAANLMERAAREAHESGTGHPRGMWQRSRSVILPAALLVLGLALELAATRFWLYS